MPTLTPIFFADFISISSIFFTADFARHTNELQGRNLGQDLMLIVLNHFQ
jgi:hypothetical protein